MIPKFLKTFDIFNLGLDISIALVNHLIQENVLDDINNLKIHRKKHVT